MLLLLRISGPGSIRRMERCGLVLSRLASKRPVVPAPMMIMSAVMFEVLGGFSGVWVERTPVNCRRVDIKCTVFDIVGVCGKVVLVMMM